MASQTDKKDEFRKYLERKRVLEVLTKSLTDLFEMESRPDDPLQYLYSKIGEHVKKEVASVPQKAVAESNVAKDGKQWDPANSKPEAAAKQPEAAPEVVAAKE